MSDWRDWRQVAETFVAERRCSNPDLVVEVLVLVLRNAHSWGDLVGAGSWVMFAPTEVYVHYVPGYRAARAYALLDRFTRWLHDRGDITSWQRDVMRSEIDAQRGAHFCATRGVPRVKELLLGCGAERTVDAFADSFSEGRDRALARFAVRVLVGELNRQLGESRTPPLGSIDVEETIASVSDRGPDATALFAKLAALYDWLAQTGRLEATHARAIAAGFASAALATTHQVA